jgi:hypothetical protein
MTPSYDPTLIPAAAHSASSSTQATLTPMDHHTALRRGRLAVQSVMDLTGLERGSCFREDISYLSLGKLAP